jgi:hypothetical protein
MSEGRAQILEMLVAGRLTVEQADQLLGALDAADTAAPHKPQTQTGRPERWDERPDDFFASLTLEDLIEFHNHGVSRTYVEQMRAEGLRDLRVADFCELYDHGITPRFVHDMREAGFAELPLDELVALYDNGVDPAFMREMRSEHTASQGEWDDKSGE